MPSICRILVLLAALALGASPAAAAQIFSSSDPPVLRGPGPWAVTYRFELHTGAQPERLVFSESTTGGFPAPVNVTGAGKVTEAGAQMVLAERVCGVTGGSLDDGAGSTYWLLELPPYTSTTLSFSLRPKGPFGLGEDQFDRATFAIADAPPGFVAGSSPVSNLSFAPVPVAQPAIATPRQVPLSVRLRLPRSRVTPGTRIHIYGTTTARIAGRRVALRASFKPVGGKRRSVRIATVRVDRNGRFSYRRWHPRRPGSYSVSASYDSHDPRLLDATTAPCGPTVAVVR